MHVCDEFRERLTEQILDHRDLENDVETQRELLVCNGCSEFYAESRELIDALSSVRFDIAEEQWEAMADRMSVKIHEDYAARRAQPSWRTWLDLSSFRARIYVPAFAGAFAMLLVIAGIYRYASPLVNQPHGTAPDTQSAAIMTPGADPDPSLDPVTVEFIEQSELLLRSVMKLHPDSAEDVAQAKKIAGRQLIALDQRKVAAFENQPVVNAMDKYETILLDIRNLNQRAPANDIADIQNRIEKTGLIDDMKSFQPRYNIVETDIGNDK